MKHLAPLTLTIAALFLAGCSGDTEATPEPTETATKKSAEEWQMENQAKRKAEEEASPDPSDEEQAFLDELGTHYIPLADDELIEAAHNACGQMMLSKLNRSAETDTVEEYTYKDISTARFSFYAQFERDWDAADDVTLAAALHICPDILDEFGYDAMRSSPFADHFEEELIELRKD